VAAFSISLLLILAGLYIAQHRIRGGYSLAKIHSTLSTTGSLHENEIGRFQELTPLLEQPFYFLSSGGTSFAFLGKDGKTILKLFKHQHLTSDSWLLHTALPGLCDILRLQKILFREQKQHHKRIPFFFKSCAIAYQRLREETCMLFLTLHKEPRCAKIVTLIDRLGVKLTIDLSQTEFALQRFVTPLFDHLKALIQSGQHELAKQAIDSLIALLRRRCEMGIADRDPHLGLNFGFLDGKAAEYDIGSFSPDSRMALPAQIKKEIFFTTYELREWLQQYSPLLLDQLLFDLSK
jgi:hypothetical protein